MLIGPLTPNPSPTNRGRGESNGAAWLPLSPARWERGPGGEGAADCIQHFVDPLLHVHRRASQHPHPKRFEQLLALQVQPPLRLIVMHGAIHLDD